MADQFGDSTKPAEEMFASPEVLAASLAPLLATMKFIGMYFGSFGSIRSSSSDVDRWKSDEHLTSNQVHQRSGNSGRWLTRYSTTILVMLWFNIVRMLSAFTPEDKFDSHLINKLVSFTVSTQCALVHTAYYSASQSGELDKLITGIRVTKDFAKKVHKLSIAFIVVSVLVTVGFVSLSAVAFYRNGFVFDFLLTPFSIYIPVKDAWRDFIKFVFLLWILFMAATWSVFISANQLVILLLHKSFQMINEKFQIASKRSRFIGQLKTYRNRHQTAREAVRSADSFLMIGNVSSFCGHVFIVVLLLYAFICIGYDDPVIATVYFLFLCNSVLNLWICLQNGVLINEVVSLSYCYLLTP